MSLILRSCGLALLVVFGTHNSQLVLGASGGLLHTYNDPTPTGDGYFGSAVALSGGRMLISASGASVDSVAGRSVGEAHLFAASTGELLRTFSNPSPAVPDEFGVSAAISGDYVVIGAIRDGTNGPAVGQAYLFDANSGAFLRTFDDPTPSSADAFGSVAIDGDKVAIGAARDDSNGQNVGQAHLFNAVTGKLLLTLDDPTPTTWDGFGWSVAIDGDKVLVGAPQDDSNGRDVGQAHLFDAVTGNLLQTFDDPTPTRSDFFGGSLAMDGDNVLIGARMDSTKGEFVGQAHLFDAATGKLLRTFNDPKPTLADEFGYAVAIDGGNILVGAINHNIDGSRVGQAHLFDAATGILIHTYNDPTPTGIDFFGSSVAIDSEHVLVGAVLDNTYGHYVGQAHLFDIAQKIPEPGTYLLLIATFIPWTCCRRLSCLGRMNTESGCI